MSMTAAAPQGRIVFSGRKIELRLVEIVRPDGQTAQRELVVHPGAVVILAFTGAGEVVLIRNTRFAVGRELWELPAGTLEPPESPTDCAVRELREETGYQAARIEPLGQYYTTPGFCTERMHAFLAGELTHVGQALEAGEQIRVELVPLRRAQEMMLSGEIADAKTIAALGLYLLRRGK